jgi:riboflavin synthase
MFTGIVEGLAEVKTIFKVKDENKAAATKLRIYLGKFHRGLKAGDSVSVNGACLTVIRLYKGMADFDVVDETIKRTCLSSIKPGDKVNLERSLRLGDRLEGHIVLGHVDGIGIIEEVITYSTETKLWIRIEDRQLLSSIVPKGSIAIDGISLTPVEVKDDKISISLIPHTLAITTLGLKSKGDVVNIEVDVLSKYVRNNLPKN